MRLLVTGREGQVVTSLVERSAGVPGVEVVTLGRPQLDLADPEGVAAAIAGIPADVIVSAAAYTAVDQAEDEPDLAHRINAEGAGALARAAAARNIPIIHLSTDYVFSGDKAGAYTETDPTGPTGVYGASKLAGEAAVAAANPRHVILRTAWVYSPFGKNFVKTMLRLAGERDELTVVGDQFGNPTSALAIADAILHVARRLHEAPEEAPRGLYHLAGAGQTSWAGFAQKIMEMSHARSGPSATVRTISTAEFPTKAKRPSNSQLSCAKLAADYGWRAPAWTTSLNDVVARLVAQR